jgi:hypothetical protein
MVSVALAGSVQDGPAPRRKTSVTIPSATAKVVTAIDLLNGFEQHLKWRQVNSDIVITDLYVADYPIVIRIAP